MSLVQYGFIILLTILFSFQLFFTNILIQKNGQQNIYKIIEDKIIENNSGNYLEDDNSHRVLKLGYIKNRYNMEIYIPKILLSSTGSVEDGDLLFSGINKIYKSQTIENGENNIDLGDDKLFLGYLYFYCIDVNNDGTCNSTGGVLEERRIR